jgi:hypothetical protein
VLPLPFRPHLQLIILPNPLDQLALAGEDTVPTVFIPLQFLQIIEDLNSIPHATDLVELVTLPLDEGDLATDKLHNVFVVVEEVLQVDFLVKLDHRTLLEKNAVENSSDGLEDRAEESGNHGLELSIQRIRHSGLLDDLLEDHVFRVQVPVVEVLVGAPLVSNVGLVDQQLVEKSHFQLQLLDPREELDQTAPLGLAEHDLLEQDLYLRDLDAELVVDAAEGTLADVLQGHVDPAPVVSDQQDFLYAVPQTAF